MTHHTQTNNWRVSAAEASGQTSGDHIYSLFEAAIKEYSITGNVLDFGAGNGELARRIKRGTNVENITCIDLLHPPHVNDDGMQWDTADLNERTPYEDQNFDAVLAAEVIEHLENPRAVLREWTRILKPGGWIIFSTPNNESIRSILALIFRGHYQAFGDESYPAHITPLLHKDIQRIAKETGIDVLAFRYTNHGMIPKTRVSWQRLSGGFLSGKRFSDNVLVVCRRSR